MRVESGLVLSMVLSRASEHDMNYFQYVVIKSMHTRKKLPKVYADKGYNGRSNREFLHINDMVDWIMRKDERNAKLTAFEIERNKMISRVRYKIEQYFGVTALHQGASRARFTTLVKEVRDRMCQGYSIQHEAVEPGRVRAACTCNRLGAGVTGA